MNKGFLRVALPLLLILPIVSLLTYSQINIYVGVGSSDYGYEFPIMQISGINSTITYYCVNVTSQIPSAQQNVCLSINNTQVFVQNVLWYYGSRTYPEWGISLYYNGSYHTYDIQPVMTGESYTLTTLWHYNGSGVEITFYMSNGTKVLNVSRYLPGVYRGLAISCPGTVIVGYGDSSIAYFAPGFNVSVSTTIEVGGKWYVPPAIFSGLPNTGESAVHGRAYLGTGNRVFVVYNETREGLYEPQVLALPSVIITGNKVVVFPFNSLWVIRYPNGTSSYFVNETQYVSGAEVCPYGNISLPFQDRLPNVTHFMLEKLYYVISNVPIYGSKSFYVPQEEYVFALVDGSYEPVLIDGNTTIDLSTTEQATKVTFTTTSTVTSTVTDYVTTTVAQTTITSYVTVHIVTSIITSITQPSPSKKLYEGAIAVIVTELIIFLLFRGWRANRRKKYPS